jgi:phospholipase C
LRFIEDNLRLGRIGNQSSDALAGSLSNLFDFEHEGETKRLFLDPATGEPTTIGHLPSAQGLAQSQGS